MGQLCTRQGPVCIQHKGAFALEGEGLGIMLFEFGDEAALAMKVDGELVFVIPAAVDADGAATAGFGREEAELAPAQVFEEPANAIGLLGGRQHQRRRSFNRDWAALG